MDMKMWIISVAADGTSIHTYPCGWTFLIPVLECLADGRVGFSALNSISY